MSTYRVLTKKHRGDIWRVARSGIATVREAIQIEDGLKATNEFTHSEEEGEALYPADFECNCEMCVMGLDIIKRG